MKPMEANDFASLIFGITLSEALRRTSISTNGLESWSTQALIGELKRRVERLESLAEVDVKPQPDEERWIPMEEAAEKYFPGVETKVVATYLAIIGCPYRLDPKLACMDYSLQKIFKEKTMKEAGATFFGNSRRIDETEHCYRMLHPLVGRYHQRKNLNENPSSAMESEPDEV